MEKKPYNMARRNQARSKVMLRAIACGYLLYLAWQLAFEGGEDSTFPPAARVAAAVLFAAAAVGFGIHSWKRYRAECREAEDIAEEAARSEELPEKSDEDPSRSQDGQ